MTPIEVKSLWGKSLPPWQVEPASHAMRAQRSDSQVAVLRPLVGAGVVVFVTLGALERWWVASHTLGTLTSDGSVIGLMALHLLHHGQLPAYMWGQAYGGSLETVLTAALFLVAGVSSGTLLATTALSSALVAFALWRTGRLVVGERAGALAALAWWIWPATAMWRSLKPGGSYMIGMAIALAAVGALAKVREGRGSVGKLVLAGVWCGLAVWTSPMSLQLLVPALVWCTPALLALGRRFLALGAGAVVGAIPALVFGATHGWSNLRVPGQSADFFTGFASRLAQFVSVEWPIALSLRVEGNLAWVGGRVGVVVSVGSLICVVVMAAMVVAGRARRCVLPVLTLIVMPVLFAMNPLADHVGQGRYVMFGATMAAVIVGVGLDTVGQMPARNRGDWAQLVAWIGGLAVLASLGLVALSMEPAGVLVGFSAPDVPMPVSDAGLRTLVAEHHIQDAYGDYWIAYRLAFETHESTNAVPYDLVRYPPLNAAVASSKDPAYLFVSKSATVGRFEHWCTAHGIAAQAWSKGGFTVVQPATKVLPAQVYPPVLG